MHQNRRAARGSRTCLAVAQLLAATVAVGLADVPAANAQPVSTPVIQTLGGQWGPQVGQVNTTISAQEVGKAAQTVGYSWHHDNQLIAQGMQITLANASIYGLFGHASHNNFMTSDPRSGYEPYDTLYGGHYVWALEPTFSSPYTNVQLAHYGRVLDSLRILILAGCKTASENPLDGVRDFFSVTPLLGIDSVIGFRELIYSPITTGTTSGAYYFTRFAAYAGSGWTMIDAVRQARADLFAKEGNNWGYDSWAITGETSNAPYERFTPAGHGKIAGVRPPKWPPSPPAVPAVPPVPPVAPRSAARSASVDAAVGLEGLRQGDDGTVVRLDEHGQLASLIAPMSTEGAVRLSENAAAARAGRMLRDAVPGFENYERVAYGGVTHIAGDALWTETWRTPLRTGRAKSAEMKSVEIELDRRTGRATFVAVASAPRGGAPFRVTRSRAVRAAQRKVRPGRVLSARRGVWDGPHWNVTVQHSVDAHGLDVRSIATVDGVTGRVIRVVGT